MAISFALDVNFGQAEEAARAACGIVADSGPLLIGSRAIGLHKPLLNRVADAAGGRYWELAVVPIGVGAGVAVDRGLERVRLRAAQYTALGHALYRLLGGITGYRAAQVGWNTQWRVDLAELRAEYADELEAGELHGLVLAENALAGLRGREFQPFAPGYVWTPYQGETASSLTAD